MQLHRLVSNDYMVTSKIRTRSKDSRTGQMYAGSQVVVTDRLHLSRRMQVPRSTLTSKTPPRSVKGAQDVASVGPTA